MHEERKNALRLLGEGLHSIQDIDAHLNVGLDTPLYVAVRYLIGEIRKEEQQHGKYQYKRI